MDKFDWEPRGDLITCPPFSVIKPLEVLYDFDGPQIFTFSSDDGTLMLAFVCDEGERLVRFIVVSTDEDVVRKLKQNVLPVRDALLCPQVWIADYCFVRLEHPLSVWALSGKDLPDNVLPTPGITLSPDSLESLENIEESDPKPYDLVFGSREEGIRLSLRWKKGVFGEVLLWLGNHLIWGNPTDDRPSPVTCELPHLLLFLVQSWNRLLLEETFPGFWEESTLENPGQFRRRILLEWKNGRLGDRSSRREKERGIAVFLQERFFLPNPRPELFLLPDLDEPQGASLDQKDEDGILFLKQGNFMLAATPSHYFQLPFDMTVEVLERLGEGICAHLVEAFPEKANPFEGLIGRWQMRKVTDDGKLRTIATGLSQDRLARVWPNVAKNDEVEKEQGLTHRLGQAGKNRRHGSKNAAPSQTVAEHYGQAKSAGGRNRDQGQEQEASLRLVARMAGKSSDDQQLKHILNNIIKVSRVDRRPLMQVKEALTHQAIVLDTGVNLSGTDFMSQGMEVAQWLRRVLNIEPQSKVEPTDILRMWKINCTDLNSTVPFDGIAVWGKKLGPEIFINPNGPRSRQPTGRRFTLAHEIGHLLVDMTGYLPHGDIRTGVDIEPYVFKGFERRANAFAAELLLPEKSVRAKLMNFDDQERGVVWRDDKEKVRKVLTELASHFSVSHELVAWKIKHTRFLTEQQAECLRDNLRSINDPY